MKLYEYQGKELLRQKGILVPKGVVLEEEDQLEKALDSIKGPPWVVKAQVHAGGRGKAGGIAVARDKEELKEALRKILRQRIKTAQTGQKEIFVKKVLLEEYTPHVKEYYIGITMDRSKALPVFLFSTMGGMEIEEVAKESPKAISKVMVDPLLGLMPYKARELVYGLSPMPPFELFPQLERLFSRLYELYWDMDLTLLEINPLCVTEKGELIALDAKLSMDENALFRHKNIKDEEEKDPLEAEAQAYGLNYIKMEGDVGVMVNGAGLAMATMDIIKLAGREPANFLDVGGGASQAMVKKGFEIIMKDPNVKMIFVNIFGGILRCDVLARGMLQALEGISLGVPLIVRLEGTNVELGREILQNSEIRFLVAQDLEDAIALIRLSGEKRG